MFLALPFRNLLVSNRETGAKLPFHKYGLASWSSWYKITDSFKSEEGDIILSLLPWDI